MKSQSMIDVRLRELHAASDGTPLSNRDIARVVGLTEQRISQIADGAIRKLRRRLSRTPEFQNFYHDHH